MRRDAWQKFKGLVCGAMPRHLDVMQACYPTAARQLGLLTRSQLRSAGVRRDRLRRLVDRGELSQLHHNVFALPGSTDSPHRDLLAKVLETGMEAAVSHSTAAWLWGLGGFAPTPVHVVVTRFSRHHQHLDWNVHQFTGLPSHHRRIHDAVPVTSPALTMLHLAQSLSERRLGVVVDRAWSLRLLTGSDLVALDEELAIQGRNGITRLRKVATRRGVGWVPPESGLETRFMQLMESVGEMGFDRQVPIASEGWSARVDFLHVPSRTIVEIQSERYHASLTDREADEARKRRLEDLGYRVVEVWDTELFASPGQVVVGVREAIRRPAA